MLNKESSKDKGGLLADDMGLGKVRDLYLMLLNRPNPRRPTLIIMPLTIIYQWKDEVEDKANNTLKCGVYHASSKQRPNSNDILTYDVVLTTYDTMSREWPNNRTHREGQFPFGTSSERSLSSYAAGLLFKTKFHRVVLDESQQIRTKETVRSLAVANLQSDLKWGLSGTPIINRLSDLYPFFRFAGIKPWCDYAEFRKQIVDVEKRDPILAAKKLQVILERMTIRRKKDTMVNGRPLVPLPPKNIELVRLEFTPREQQLYDQYERRSQEKMQKLIAAGTVLKNCTFVLVQLLRLRQLCTHPSLIKDLDFGQEKPAGAVGAEDEQVLVYARRVMGDRGVVRLQERFRQEDLKCPICMDAFTDATVTACGHVFCRECISPSCRTPCSKNILFPRAIFKVSLNEGENDAIENLGLPVAQSTKMKILIISQWTQCLSLASDCLKEAGIVHVKYVPISCFFSFSSLASFFCSVLTFSIRYQGDMNQTRRSAAVKALNEEGDTRVMLLSLKCGGVGLNLTRANTVVSLDLGWSQAVEEQAFDRVHRMGQKREVKVHRLVIANTVEDRILALQARKQNLADGSLGEGTGAKIGSKQRSFHFDYSDVWFPRALGRGVGELVRAGSSGTTAGIVRVHVKCQE
ncbi:SNF2 family N-terminal domain-containing protein [Mycena floridula]|nr:SNF2 family N-terminal domain-containing protein [Mycena floridula]